MCLRDSRKQAAIRVCCDETSFRVERAARDAGDRRDHRRVREIQLSFAPLVILLGSIGYTAVGTLLAAMSVQTRTRDVLLPILLFPVAFSVLLAAVKASGGFLSNSELTEILLPINLLIAYDVIFIAVAFMVFDIVVEE